jgi:hypothetical protein
MAVPSATAFRVRRLSAAAARKLQRQAVAIGEEKAPMLEQQVAVGIADIVAALRDPATRDDNFCVFGDSDEALRSDGVYYLDAYALIDDDDETYSEFVTANRLQFLYSGQQFADVVDVLAREKPDASLADYVAALNYYAERDTFMPVE